MLCIYPLKTVIGNSLIAGLLYPILREQSRSAYKEMFQEKFNRVPNIDFGQSDYETFNVFQHAYAAGMMSLFIGPKNVLALGILKEYRDVSVDSKIFESYKDFFGARLGQIGGQSYNSVF